MLIVQVQVHVKQGMADRFIEATIKNASKSIHEPGIARFDIIRQKEDQERFILVEAYRDSNAPAKHKETEHYGQWRKTVEPMMAEPRKSIKYINTFPDDNGW
ncbi:MAG: antibiotic biosynthesis monooxygenase [Actinomycetota bacterium]|nr:MAG: antibiotic biosynthesis monooxygenase [Actinomycetota bacterium]